MRFVLVLALVACCAGCAQAPSTTPTADAYISDQLKKDNFDLERSQIINKYTDLSVSASKQYSEEAMKLAAEGKQLPKEKSEAWAKQTEEIQTSMKRDLEALGKKYGVNP